MATEAPQSNGESTEIAPAVQPDLVVPAVEGGVVDPVGPAVDNGGTEPIFTPAEPADAQATEHVAAGDKADVPRAVPSTRVRKSGSGGERFVNGLVLVALVFGIVLVTIIWAKPSPSFGVCRHAPASVGTGQVATPIATSLPTGTVTSFSLGTDVNAGARLVSFTLASPLNSPPDGLSVHVGTFARDTDGRELPATYTNGNSKKESPTVVAWARVNPDGSTANAYICIPSDERANLPSGTFSGQLTIDDPRVQPLVIPITISLSYTQTHVVVLAGLFICFLASLYVFILRAGKTETADPALPSEITKSSLGLTVLRSPFGLFRRYYDFATDVYGVITIVAGLVAASAVFTALYGDAAVWDASMGSWIKYAGAIASAFVAGGTAGKLAQIQFAQPISTDQAADSGTSTQPENPDPKG